MTFVLFDVYSAAKNFFGFAPAPPLVSSTSSSFLQSQAGNYQAQARQYLRNEVVYAAIRLLSTSAAEPQIIGRRWRREKPTYANNRHAGFQARMRNQYLIENRFVEEVPNHPLVKLLNNPNPYTTRAKFMRFLTMDTYISGNRFILCARGEYGNIAAFYRLRPDRVKIIPDKDGYAAAYAYTVGNQTVIYPAEDVIHGSEPHPLNDVWGLAPVDVAMARADIDEAMREHLGGFYLHGGSGPGAVLTVTGKLSEAAKAELRARFRRLFNSPSAVHDTLILDQGQSSYQRLGLDRGLADAVPKDVNAINEARLSLPFAIPGSILGLLIGYESSSYANKRADWQVFWDITMTPFLSEIDDELTKALCTPRGGLPAEFSGVDEVLFDLSDIRALQEDEDDLSDRHIKRVTSGVESWEEGRSALGLDPNTRDGIFFVPSTVVATHVEDIGEPPEPPQLPPTVVSPDEGQSDDAMAVANAIAANFRTTALLEAPRRGRPGLSNDGEARALYRRSEQLRVDFPGMTNAQIAARVGVSLATLKRYRAAFAE